MNKNSQQLGDEIVSSERWVLIREACQSYLGSYGSEKVGESFYRRYLPEVYHIPRVVLTAVSFFCSACGILASQPEMEFVAPTVESRVLTTVLPEKSLSHLWSFKRHTTLDIFSKQILLQLSQIDTLEMEVFCLYVICFYYKQCQLGDYIS